MEAKQLAHLIRDRIAKDGEMTLTQIRERGAEKGIDEHIVLAAMSIVGRFKDVQVRVKGNDNVYSIRQLRETAAVIHTPRVVTEEEKELMEQYWLLNRPPWVSDEERDCYVASKSDRMRWKTCTCATCTEWRLLLMTRDERIEHEKETNRGE